MSKLAVLLSLVLILAGSCQHEEAEHHEVTPKLEVTTPLIQDVTVTREYVGQVHASRHIELRALERGYLQSIYVDEGQSVRKGQKMFKILPNIYEAELQIKKAEAELAGIEYKNTKLLADEKVVAPNELAMAKAHVDRANAEVTLAEAHLDFTNIRAPYDGIMDHLEAREGSLLEEGELLTTLSDNSKMWIYFSVPEAEYLDYVANTDKPKQQHVRLRMANGQDFGQDGVVEAIEGEFDHETGNIEFRATFPNPGKVLRHGETGSVLLPIPYEHALVIPQKATFEILDKKYVYVVTKDNKLEQRPVVIAEELPHVYVVRDGLQPDDRILIEGLRKVRNGDTIEVDYQAPERAMSQLALSVD
ncbi:efflux RND transporter periplasmic adaptor subunit [Lewinella sp. IMCC34183]|uniref:efflux RND transporter periplasmic adaptor subunit n=1 Tax=Lewinella sp. IMCC34183 TaxID=2248762 RepID=UPI000E263377|nr:efflux RND transporter periplasmic adaptor subunit [Lewinella sp. IMCC34183]